jgi:hypothetical protein
MWAGAGNWIGFGSAGTLDEDISSGAGDPYTVAFAEANLQLIYTSLIWEILEEGSTRSREAAPLVYAQHGGELIDVVAQEGFSWQDKTYKIQLISVLDQIFPDDRPGAFGAVEGQGSTLHPLYGNTVLRFAVPRAPLGAYDVLITSEDDQTVRLKKAIRLVPSPTSLEVNRYRTFFNPEVYSKRGPFT